MDRKQKAADQVSPLCSECGAPNAHASSLFVIDELSSKQVAALLQGMFDDALCGQCHHSLFGRPSLAIVVRDPNAVHFLPGTWLNTSGEFPDEEEFSIFEYETIESLKLAIQARVIENIRQVEETPQGIRPTKRFFAGFSTLYLLPSIQCPGPKIQSKFPDEQFELAGDALGSTWIEFARTVGDRISASEIPDLETAISNNIDSRIILPKASVTYLDWLTSRKSAKGFEHLFAYIALATGVAVCRAANVDFPHSEAWIERLFEFELHRAIAPSIEEREHLSKFALSDEFLAGTVPFAVAWDATAGFLTALMNAKDSSETAVIIALEAISRALERCGHRGLFDTIFSTTKVFVGDEHQMNALQVDPSDIAGLMNAVPDLGLEAVIGMTSWLSDQMKDADDLEELADWLLARAIGDDDARAHIFTWIASRLVSLREPMRTLKKIGGSAAPWEKDLAPRRQAALWTERGNSLRLLGRPKESLVIAEQVEALCKTIGDDDLLRVAEMNVAILQRELGLMESALPVLERLAATEPAATKAKIVESLAVALHLDDRHLEAAEHLSLARKDLPALDVVTNAKLIALEAQARANAGQLDQAEQLLASLPKRGQGADDPAIPLAEASALVLLLCSGKEISRALARRYAAVDKSLLDIVRAAIKRSDVSLINQGLTASAFLAAAVDDPHSALRWAMAIEFAERFDLPANPAGLIFLTRAAYELEDAAAAQDHLTKLVTALVTIYERTTNIEAVLNGVRGQQRWMVQMTQAALGSGVLSPVDFRVIGEAGRIIAEEVRRRRLRLPGAETATSINAHETLGDASLRRLAPKLGSVGILEWLDAGGGIQVPQLTVISADGSVRATRPRPPDLNLRRLTAKIRTRLSNWHSKLPGDPFDLPEWGELEGWALALLGAELTPGDHVVFFDAPSAGGLPWHVAAATSFPSSYAAGWSALFDATTRTPTEVSSAGIVAVPRYRESNEVVRAFQRSVEKAERLGRRLNIAVREAVGAQANSDEVHQILTTCDLVYLLCHGRASGPEGNDVDLLVACEGRLPLAQSMLIDGEVGREHLLGWRALSQLKNAPVVVVSAACSSGLGPEAGLGDRVGLFSALRPAGTKAMVAPLWDVMADAATQAADQVIERHVALREPLGTSVWEVGKSQALRLPRWMAWNLALEGNWR